MNVAVGLARLGQPTSFAGRLSADPFGTLLRRHLEHSSVQLDFAVAAAEPATIALVELVDGQAHYEFRLGADFSWSADELRFLPGGAVAVHFGSLASWLPPGDAAIAEAIGALRSAGSVLISYDPNVRPSLLPDAADARQRVEESVGLAHLVKASLDDLHWLYGSDATADAVAGRWLDLGASLVVITAGAAGATGWAKGLLPVSQPALPAEVIDTVGAGDAFMSGLLDGLARRGLLSPASLATLTEAATLAGALTDASRIAGITCSRMGANPPSRAEADAWPDC